MVSLVVSSSSMFYLEMINSFARELNYSAASAEGQNLNERYIRRLLNVMTLTWRSPF
jgi:deoxyhypusine synthase